MYNYNIKASFFCPDMPKSQAKKMVFNLWLYIFIFVENWISYDARHNFSVCLRTSSNPINRFRSDTGNSIISSHNALLIFYLFKVESYQGS